MDGRTLQEGRHGVNRRRFSVGLCLGLLATLAGCGGSSDGVSSLVSSLNRQTGPGIDTGSKTDSNASIAPSTSTGTVPTAWDVVPNRALALAAGTTFDLAATLPSSVRTGGTFELDASGAPLPAGITLLPTGLLTVSSSATGDTAGVVFRYTPPA